MSKLSGFKKLLLLAAGYVAGSTVSSLYSSKKGKELQKELKKAYDENADPTGLFLDNFIELHKNMFETIKKKVTSAEAKEFFKNKKEEVFKLLDKYKLQGEKMIDELKVKGKDYVGTASERLEEFFRQKKVDFEEYLESIKLDEEDIKEYKAKFESIYTSLKKRLKK